MQLVLKRLQRKLILWKVSVSLHQRPGLKFQGKKNYYFWFYFQASQRARSDWSATTDSSKAWTTWSSRRRSLPTRGNTCSSSVNYKQTHFQYTQQRVGLYSLTLTTTKNCLILSRFARIWLIPELWGVLTDPQWNRRHTVPYTTEFLAVDMTVEYLTSARCYLSLLCKPEIRTHSSSIWIF